MAYQVCVCGSKKFIADILSGYQEIIIDEDDGSISAGNDGYRYRLL